MEDAEWVETQRIERAKIMDKLDEIETELKRELRKLDGQPQIDAGYSRLLKAKMEINKVLLQIIDKRLQNLGNKAELEHALEKIKAEVKEIVNGERPITIGDARRAKTKPKVRFE